MTSSITTLTAADIDLIAGGVTAGPDGTTCTEPRQPRLLGRPELWGGPIKVDLFP